MAIPFVTGGKDGLVCDNTYNKKGEPLIDVAKLKATYLFGVKIVDNNTGEEMPDDVFQVWIDNAIAMLETYLDISITPVKQFEEFKDYHLNDYAEWGYFQLNNFPVIGIRSMEMVYFRDQNGVPQTVQTIPNEWLRLQAHDGIVRLIPNARFPANLQISQTGAFFPELLRAQLVPHLWKITYDYGFEVGCVPVLLNQAISMLAAMQAFIVAGHLILGAGIAATSISLDGLSQNIQTTQSAENSGYSAVIKDMSGRLFGTTKDDPFAIMTVLKAYYKGESITIL
jgi:hypothetical protein